MRRLTLLAVAILVAVVPVTVAGAGVNASVTGVDVTPSGPAPGETVTFTPTVRNLQSSSDSLDIRAIALRRAGGGGITEYTRVRNVGTITPGSEIQVPLTHTFETAGTRDMRVFVYAYNPNASETVQLRYPVSVSVRERHPQLDIKANDSVAGVPSSGTVTVANGLDTNVSNAEITVSGDGVTMLEERTVVATLGPGDTVTAPFRFRPESEGPHELEATLSYTIAGDTERTVTRSKTIRSEGLREGVVLDATGVGSGGDRALAVDVINRGNAPIEDVVVTAASDNATFRQAIVREVEPGSSERVRLNATLSEPRANVTVETRYEVGTAERRATTTTELRSAPGTIGLTGLSVSREGGVVQITGSASNLGMTEANSVVLSVVPTDSVEPAAPNKDYFVGTVPASDFVSFDLTARTDGNVTSVPVEVSYLVDGDRKRQTVQVNAGSADTSQNRTPTDQRSSSGLLPVAAVGAVALLIVGGILVRRYQRGDDDEDL
ncbi:hypothetical protein [Haloarcula pellucida]|uniref:CARDB domain-containing protein n=1 Tax=Haloarcula pellucida TaxID=1427151 RepID=A0A830GH74_9EURY|nr:hypothetical protein [Halomicroarcula pellucida]MBX0347111.1 hypothetical protein [Halomicroarcula pellucida]GGN87040.1 hypothetical protein GCM10009030_05310 [Halomicroarcula pellucida]